MTVRDPSFWRFKASALLLPTPLSGVDPTGEAERAEKVRQRFGLTTEVDDAALGQCHRDAACAQSAGNARVVGAARRPRDVSPSLKHPLAPECTTEGTRLEQLRADWEHHWQGLPSAVETSDDYCKLWRAFVEPEAAGLRHLVHDETVPDYTVWAERSLAAAFAAARHGGQRPALVLLQVGPVQEFIEASRRTHDLWGGSYIISTLAFEALRSVAEYWGPDAVLTPWPVGLELAERHLFQRPWKKDDPSARMQPSLPAKVMALVADGPADEVVRAAHQAVRAKWREMAKAVWTGLKLDSFRAEKRSYFSNIDSFLELGGAVLRWPESAEEAGDLLRIARWPRPPSIKSDEEIAVAYGPLSGLLWTGLSSHSKTCLPTAAESAERPKCTVCGQRDQVGLASQGPDTVRNETIDWRNLAEGGRGVGLSSDREAPQLSSGEGLCAVCLTRRFAPQYFFGTETAGLELRWDVAEDRPYLRFPSVPSVAVAPFRRWLKEEPTHRDRPQQAKLDAATRTWVDAVERAHRHKEVDFTPPGNLLPGLGALGGKGKGGQSAYLKFDGSWCFDEAYEPERILRDHGWTRLAGRGEPDDELVTAAQEGGAAFSELCGELGGRASPYVAVLYLDGDEMSRWLNGDHCRTPTLDEVMGEACPPGEKKKEKRPVYPAQQAEISRRLCGLATGAVAKIVDRYLGRLVYCGGDDVLALLPLATVLPCAAKLNGLFCERDRLGPRVTTSAGIAVFHCRTPLRAALKAAREAEKRAKHHGRDQLAIHLDVRSGVPLDLLWPWRLNGDDTVERLIGTRIEDPMRGDAESFRAKVAFSLREELPALAGNPDMFLHRLSVRLYGKAPERLDPSVQEWSCLEALSKRQQGAELVVDTLRLLLFLKREEHGIPTHALLDLLERNGGGVS